MKTNFLMIAFIILLASCNSAQDSKADQGATTPATDTATPGPAAPPDANNLTTEHIAFQAKLDSSLNEIDIAKALIIDSISVQKDAVLKRDLNKAKLNLTYLSNGLARAKVDYLVSDIEKLNTSFAAHLNAANTSLNKIGNIARTLNSINKSIGFVVKLGKALITKGLVKVGGGAV